MNSKIFLNSIFILILFTTSTDSYALGKLGHKLVCQLAFDHLPKGKQQTIMQLLKSIPPKHQQAINKYNYQAKHQAISFANSCTWADAIKKNPTYDKYKSWHYFNIARNSTKISHEQCKQDCLLKAIDVHQDQLAIEQDIWKKTQALMFLSHWIGDIHQPLHVSYASDKGGNHIKIKRLPSTKCNNLHWLWDDCLLSHDKPKLAKLVQKLAKQWKKSPIKQWQQNETTTWATESLKLIRTPEFSYCKLDNAGFCYQTKSKQVVLSEKYLESYGPVLHHRILQAAVRLNQRLDISL